MVVKETANVNSEITSKELFTGDLLFMIHPNCNISQAIDQATQTDKKTHFSHIGIVEKDGEVIRVYHSTPKKGVCCEPLEQFIHPDDCKISMAVYRLKEQYQKAIPKAIESARNYLGLIYNHSFIHTEAGYYCSEFIYKIYAPNEIFDLYPMTFKDPSNGEFIPAWVEYYHQLGISIPEGEPGCNPNGIAASDKIEMLGELKLQVS
jgi:uncharacterized protein YycO